LRQLGDAELARLIVTIYDGSLQTYGAPRIQLELADEHDVHVGRKRVARLMRDLGIEGVKGVQIRFHAASSYWLMRPPSRERRSMAAVGERTARTRGSDGSGGVRLSDRCGLWVL
jgi:transposase InsO family protein